MVSALSIAAPEWRRSNFSIVVHSIHHVAGPVFWASNSSELDQKLALVLFVHLPWFLLRITRSVSARFVNSLKLGFIVDGSSFATHSAAFFARLLSPFKCLCFSVILTIFLREEELFSVCDVWAGCATSMVVVFTSSRISRRIFSLTSNSSLKRKSAAVMTEPAICVFEVELQQKIACAIQRWWSSPYLKETRDWFVSH